MIVNYEAVDPAGRRLTDTIEAPDVRSAIEALRRRNLYVTNVAGQAESQQKSKKATKAGASASQNERDQAKVHISAKQLTTFTRQMSMLLTAGSGVVPALHSVGRQFTKPDHVKMIQQLCFDLEEGTSLTDALRRFPRVFDSTYCAIIAAGEASGTLTEMFARLAKVVGKRRAQRSKVLGAMVYPALLTALSFNIIAVLIFFVLPRFGDMFKTLNVDLPLSTMAMIGAGEFARNYWYVTAGVVVALLAGAFSVFGSAKGRLWVVAVLTRLPLTGRLVNGLFLGETFRVLGMLTESRVGPLEAINLVRGVTGDARFQALYDGMENEITSGGSLSRALESSKFVPPYICHAVHTGEESGNLGGSMTYVADILDEDNTELLATVTRLFEPIVLIGMGLVVGGVAISLFLPMFDVTSAVG